MNYDQYRKTLIADYYDYQLESLLVNGFNPNNPTVILLPGGMGSQLESTEKPYPESPNIISDVIWLDLGIATSLDALKMEVDDRGRDKNSYVVAPHGPVNFIGTTP